MELLMKRSLVLAAALAAALPFSALAHKAWLQPSQTVIAGDHPWITVDAAVSNDLFYFNHVPLRLESLVITAPDGTTVQPQNASTGKFRSVFDVELTQQGTYRLASVNNGLSASWEEDGKPKRWRGTVATFATEVPKKARKLQVSQSVNRIETFVTNGTPNSTALAPTKSGIELVAVGHPNDLAAGEEARFRVLVDGKPRAGLAFEITRGGTRYRNAQEEIKVTSDKKGEFSVTWPEAGMYWLETSSEDKKTTLKQAKTRRLNYVATLEVLPL
jgi:uncharacterized GH25 family protein